MKMLILSIGLLFAGLCIGFFVGKAFQQQRTLAHIDITNQSGQSIEWIELASRQGPLDAGSRTSIVYGMHGEGGYDLHVGFTDGTVADLENAYVESGRRQALSIRPDRTITVK